MEPSRSQPVVAVFGSSTLSADDPAFEEVRTLGGELARAGFAVMTGGYGGAMAAASRGANEAGGHVIGVTVELFEARGAANEWVHERVHTPNLFARLEYIMNRADAFVVVRGSIGTLTELFLAWTLAGVQGLPATPVVLMGRHWHEWLKRHRGPEFVPEHLFRFVEIADTSQAAVRAVAAGLERKRAAVAGADGARRPA